MTTHRLPLALLVAVGALLSACAGLPHADPTPDSGQGGYAEWRWPFHEPGESWADQLPHPDKVPTAFRTAQVRLQQMRQGCAWLIFPAYVTVAERQYNKALRAFAAEFYDDAFVDLRALNNQLDEIDKRLQIAGAGAGCSKRRNRYCDGESHGPCTGGGCGKGHCAHDSCADGRCTDLPFKGCQNCGHTGPEFNCASGTGLLNKPGCGCRACPETCRDGRCPVRAAAAQPPRTASAPPAAARHALQNVYLKAQFPYNSDQVFPEYRGYLRDLAAKLASAGHPLVEIEGHASAEGSSAYNLELSARRAASVRRILMSEGVPPASIRLSEHGESRPTASNSTETGRAENRRVEIYLLERLPPPQPAAVKRRESPFDSRP